MDTKEYIELISRQGPDIEALIESFSEKVLTDESLRNMVVDQMVTNGFILVYYHSFLIVEKAIQKSPELFYIYWDRFEALLEHENSYHRNYAMSLLAKLTIVDNQEHFKRFVDKYFERLEDVKFLTRRYCIIHSLEIIKNKPDFCDRITEKIVGYLSISTCTEKQQNLLISDFMQVVEDSIAFVDDKKGLVQFLYQAVDQSRSVKLKKQIASIVKKLEEEH